MGSFECAGLKKLEYTSFEIKLTPEPPIPFTRGEGDINKKIAPAPPPKRWDEVIKKMIRIDNANMGWVQFFYYWGLFV